MFNKINNSIVASGKGSILTARSFTRLQMSFLGVMFAGMALYSTFGGLIKMGVGMTGIFDALSAAIGFLLLPIILTLLPYILGFINWIFNLDENTRMVIGTIILIVAAVGIFLMILGQVVVFLGSVIIVFEFLGGVISLVVTILTALGLSATAAWAVIGIAVAAVVVIIAAVIAVIALLVAMWITDFGNIQKWTAQFADGLIDIFMGVWDIFAGVFDMIMAIIELNPDKFLTAFKKVGEGIQDIFTAIFSKLIPAIGGFIVDSFTQVSNWLMKLPDFLREVLNGVIGVEATNLIMGTLETAYKVSPMGMGSTLTSWAKENNITTASLIPDLSSIATASGGIFTSPALRLIGEAGPEAVVPLNRAGGFSNNTTNITVNATLSNNVDVDYLARRLSEINERDKRRYFTL
jgi:hypothetical protein